MSLFLSICFSNSVYELLKLSINLEYVTICGYKVVYNVCRSLTFPLIKLLVIISILQLDQYQLMDLKK